MRNQRELLADCLHSSGDPESTAEYCAILGHAYSAQTDGRVLLSGAVDRESPFARSPRNAPSPKSYGAFRGEVVKQESLRIPRRSTHPTASDRQLLDAAGVWSVQADQLDGDYLRQWATKLGVTAQLDDVCQGRIKPKYT